MIDPMTAESLNRGCACRTLDPDRLRRQLEAEPSLVGLYGEIASKRPHLFSATTAFISTQQLQKMTSLVKAVEAVVQTQAYQHRILKNAPAIAQQDHGLHGVFMGYDFHLGEHGPQLIEINTNAGGALLNVALARAQHACCVEMESALEFYADFSQIEQEFFTMFVKEWSKQRGNAALKRVAIVDDDPENQYLYPEFKLFERLFSRFGVEAVISDAKDLIWRERKLWHTDKMVDLVYNRLTDFYLEKTEHAALRKAYEHGDVVLTPHPRAHALYADKRNLVLFSDRAQLEALNISPATCDTLMSSIPHTVCVLPEKAEVLWAQRRTLFFKPAAGYGSKAAYRGDKLTRRVWDEILSGDYVAQALIPPSERLIQVDDTEADLKFDVRAYVYNGNIQLLAARLYSGQTTNFRTEGGGFAPVIVVE